MIRKAILFLLLALPVLAAGPTASQIFHLAPSIVEPSDENVTLMTFTLRTTEEYPNGKWTGSGAFKATSYTGSPSDLSKVALYADNGDNTSSTTSDTLCGYATTAYLGKYSFKPALACNLDTNVSKKFYIIVNIASNATNGNAIDLRIDANDLIFVGGTAPSTAINPTGQAYVHEIIPDNTAPATTHDAPNTWQGAAVTVSFTCTDTQSGCNIIHAKLNGVESTATGNSLSMAVVNDGVHAIEYWSEDNSGNIESHQTINVSVDTGKPTLAGYSINPNKGKENDNLTFSATFADNLSGIEHTVSPLITWENEPEFCDDTFIQNSYSSNVWTGKVTIPADCDGTATIVIADAQDKAGNKIVQTAVGTFTIDNTPPPAPILISLLNNALTNNNTPTFTWMTNSSDVDHYVFQLSTTQSFSTITEEANVTLGTSSHTVSSLQDGTYYWRVGNVDAVGHVTYSSSRAFTYSSKYINIYTIALSTGNTLTNPTAGVQLNITTTDDITLFIATHQDTSGTPTGYSDDWGLEYDFSVTDFNEVDWPVEIRMLYNDSMISGLDESTLRIGWYDNGWELFPSTDSGVDTSQDYAWVSTDSFIHIGGFGNTPAGASSTMSYSSGYRRSASGGQNLQTTQPTEATNSEQQANQQSEQQPAIPDTTTEQPETEEQEQNLLTGSFVRQSPIRNAFFAILILMIITIVGYGTYKYLKKPKIDQPQF